MYGKRIRFNKLEFIYDIYVFAIIFNFIFETSVIKNYNDSVIHDIFLVIALIAATTYIVLKKYTLMQFYRLIMLNSMGVFCYFSSGNTNLLLTILAVTLLPKSGLDRVLKLIFKERLILFIGIVFASVIGIISSQNLELYKYTYTTVGKTMGFAHPNVFAAEAVSLILMYLCIVRKQIKKVHIFVSMFFCGLIYILSQGRIAFFVGIIVIVLIALRKKKSIESIIYNFLPLSYIMVIILVIFFMAVYALLGENNLIVKILNDGFYNGRIGLAYRSLLAYPITLFGKAIDTSIWNQWQYYSLDNGQVMVLLEYGVAGFLTYYWLYKKTLIHIKQEKDIVFAIVIMGFILMSTYEGTMYFLGKNFTFLFLGTVNIESNQLFRKGDVHDT